MRLQPTKLVVMVPIQVKQEPQLLHKTQYKLKLQNISGTATQMQHQGNPFYFGPTKAVVPVGDKVT